MVSAKLDALFQDYAAAHRHPTNQLTHKIAIPLIVFHIIAMLDWVTLAQVSGYRVSLGHAGYLLTVAWYLRMNLKLGFIMGLLFALCFPLGRVTPMWAVIAIAVVGWAVQLAGHSIWEKNRPAFLKNLAHALIGPMFFVALLVGDWNPRRAAPAPAP